ncbi:Formylglycine-generating enzyme, required for sulfatase activity, contains SUMF1/FGE domain [Thiothrix caldifontis]|uniref:Formylglycine-generating enzyme, required for sulfatase activity, contains SUMF1/FGE domain n=1 Tax=Thiothrix caldifontis TaxID=525918 RepID=A0A1H4FFQ1_9GAMM|nr:SUMF1/EgtB/PvdO family nonheme iron enzyme [Thiothrix caldifontis]SEA96179.1 Formylglycine-generating enzyme, required for sulfatase activity, contains SUMF1/FGE domain [Thiothrix caldifontis]
MADAPQTAQIFLSYSRTNLEAAIVLRTELEKAGFTVFRDEDSIRAGDNWMERLQAALQGCSAFVLLYGREGVRRWVWAEVQYALSRNLSPHDDALRLPIFPVLLPEGDLHNLPPFLSLFQIQRWQPEQALPATLIQAIRDKTELLDDSNTFEGCPYLGLSAFQPEHANLFFGRREETLDALKLLGTLRDDVRPDRIRVDGQYCRWLQIEGNSGSGKSSLVNAGMLPLIQQGILWARTGYEHWHILKPMMPGEKPLQQLAEVLEHSLLPEQQRDIGKRHQCLLADEKALALRLRDFKQDGKAFLLVVDQFEELFTFSDQTEKLHFDMQLYTALQDKDCPLFVISTVRIDFLEHFEQLLCLKALYRQRLCERYLLPTVTQRGLQEAIEQPARLAGLDVSAVTTAMLNDAKNEPGALPLVENALRVLWEQREGNRLSGELYLSKGGIAGLLEEQADDLLKRLDSDLPKGKADALELLLALTRINDEGRHTRRRLPLGEARLAAGGKQADPKRGQQVIDYLTGRLTPDGGNRKANGSLRLLVTVGDNEHDQSIDLIHETLIRAKGKDEVTGKQVGYWKTLYDYIDKNRERGFYRDQLARQAKEWQGKKGLGRWFNLAGWGDLRAYRKLRPERGSVDERFLSRSRRVGWLQGGALVLLLGFVGESYLWTLNNGLPPNYMLTQQKFRLMDWGILPEPLPEMLEIPLSVGEFQMGDSNEDKYKNSMKNPISKESVNLGDPPIRVTLTNPFALGKFELTYEQYDYYVWSQRENDDSPAYPSNAPNENARGQRAVVNVSWNDAQNYLQWLSIRTGDNYRLPTEAEWEYAARGGLTTPYWWGNNIGKNNANCRNCGSQWDNTFVAPVGSFKPNPFGLYDTVGNVWEWTCSDWRMIFNGDEKICTQFESDFRVSRGGSWNIDAIYVNAASRSKDNVVERHNNVGLRVLRTARTH